MLAILPLSLILCLAARISGSKPSLWPAELDSARRWLLQDPFVGNVLRPSSTGYLRSRNGFDAQEATVEDVHDALFSGSASCRQIVSSYLARIEAFNPFINAIIATNHHALAYADTIDRMLDNGTSFTQFPSPTLLCVPILLKDNFDTFDMPTTTGSLAFADSQPLHDAPTVAYLRAAGAIILGKTNLHELASEGLTVSSLGGQTLNPYDLTRTPGGSSGGSGAAVAASFCVFATGTDTVNSLRSPASANGLISLRPSRGLFTRYGTIPAGGTQDAVGVIARRAADLMLGYRTMWSPEGELANMRVEDLDDGLPCASVYDLPLRNLTFKVVDPFVGTDGEETKPVREAFARFLRDLQAAGANVGITRDSMFDPAKISALDVQSFEFREDLNEYLSRPRQSGNSPRSFEELFASSEYMTIPARYKHIQDAHVLSRDSAEYQEALGRIAKLQTDLREGWNVVSDWHSEHESDHVDFLIFPEQRNLVRQVGAPTQSGRNGHLGALIGLPVLAFPAGFSASSTDAPRGVPIGVEIIGQELDDMKLLRLAARLETIFEGRRPPVLTSKSVDVGEYAQVPYVVPNRTLSDAYPLGRYRSLRETTWSSSDG